MCKMYLQLREIKIATNKLNFENTEWFWFLGTKVLMEH